MGDRTNASRLEAWAQVVVVVVIGVLCTPGQIWNLVTKKHPFLDPSCCVAGMKYCRHQETRRAPGLLQKCMFGFHEAKGGWLAAGRQRRGRETRKKANKTLINSTPNRARGKGRTSR
ncbi:hypothetical protein LZ32DRAFT_266808 [Colletotrichum eremochloae]|nr:hypothetical protein LZ32DRAFT_266808 [Colletotrichum eremochloae]